MWERRVLGILIIEIIGGWCFAGVKNLSHYRDPGGDLLEIFGTFWRLVAALCVYGLGSWLTFKKEAGPFPPRVRMIGF